MMNCAVLCFGCHQRHHAGQLKITGRAPDLLFAWQREDEVESAMAGPSWDWVSGDPDDAAEPDRSSDEVDLGHSR